MALSLAMAGCFVNSQKQLSKKSSDQTLSDRRSNKTITTPREWGHAMESRHWYAYNEWYFINPISHYHDATHNPHSGTGMRGQAVRIFRVLPLRRISYTQTKTRV